MNDFVKVGSTKFFKYSECNAEDVLISKGKYLGSVEGQYGLNHKFEDSGTVTVLNSSGKLNYLIKNFLTEGDVCKVVFKGKEKLKTGKMKGKEAYDFEVFKLGGGSKIGAAPKEILSALDELE